MSNLVSRLLIVDTSVVRSAGETEHPVSSACRKCLLAILEICHRVAVTDDIKKEWNRNMSRFSRKWWRSMAARKKSILTVQPVTIALDIIAFTASAQTAIKKDLCLLEAASAADHILVTRDNALMTALSETQQGIDLRQSLRWINPAEDDPDTLRTL